MKNFLRKTKRELIALGAFVFGILVFSLSAAFLLEVVFWLVPFFNRLGSNHVVLLDGLALVMAMTPYAMGLAAGTFAWHWLDRAE